MTIHIPLNKANWNTIYIPTPYLATLQQQLNHNSHSEVGGHKHMTDQREHILMFDINRDTEEKPSLTWKFLAQHSDLHGDYLYDFCCLQRSLLP